MRTRTFCPGCGGYRDIEDGHRVCTFCEYLDEQRDPARALSRELLPRSLNIEGVDLVISFSIEQGSVVAIIEAADPRYRLLADCLTVTWKLKPAALLESLCDHRAVTVGGEFYTITYGDDPEHGEGGAAAVTIFDGETERVVPVTLFSAVVIAVARLHLQLAGEAHFSWMVTLSPAAKMKLL